MSNAVLVLNANYEPVNIVGVRRAVVLILSDRALLVANGRGFIHTVNSSFPLPSVIRLEKQVHRPRYSIRLTRKEVFRRDGFTCQYCGRHGTDLTVDHEGGRTVEEAGMHLIRLPKEPPASASYIFGRYLPDNHEWEPFLQGW